MSICYHTASVWRTPFNFFFFVVAILTMKLLSLCLYEKAFILFVFCWKAFSQAMKFWVSNCFSLNTLKTSLYYLLAFKVSDIKSLAFLIFVSLCTMLLLFACFQNFFFVFLVVCPWCVRLIYHSRNFWASWFCDLLVFH